MGFNNRHLFLPILEAGNSNIKVLANLVPGEGSLSGLHFAGSSHGRETQRDSKLSGVSFREHFSHHEDSPPRPHLTRITSHLKYHDTGAYDWNI